MSYFGTPPAPLVIDWPGSKGEIHQLHIAHGASVACTCKARQFKPNVPCKHMNEFNEFVRCFDLVEPMLNERPQVGPHFLR